MSATDPERLALLVRSLQTPPWLAHLYAEQMAVVRSRSRYKCITVPRQTGKTVLLTALAVDALQRAPFGQGVLYLAKTQSIATGLIWAPLVQANRVFNLGWSFNKSERRIETPTGGYLIVRGAEGANPSEHMDTLRGGTYCRVLLDEPATYAESLDRLLSEVVEPGTDIPQGDIIVAGTPGYVCKGPFWEISDGDNQATDPRPKWQRFRWSGDKNPARPANYLERIKAEHGFTDDDPVYQIEYLGKWTISDALQVYRYADSRNGVDEVPSYEREAWVHTVGVDFGLDDECAWTVIASHPHQQDAYVVESFKEKGKRPDEAAEITAALVAKYRPDVLVGDGGNLGGNLYIEAINARLGEKHSVRMEAANKNEKRAYIDLINGDFRSGKVKLLRSSTQPLVGELLYLPWANSQRLHEHKAYDNHCADSMLYAWRHHSAYMHTAPSRLLDDPMPGEDGYQEWLMKRDEEQHRALIERPWWA